MGWVGLGGLRVDGSVRVTLCPSVSLWPLELALWPLWYSQLSLRGALFLLEQIPWNQCEGCLAASSGRAADGHDDMCVDEPKLMNIRLFLSPSTVFLIKKTDSANNLSFLLREYEQSGKWTCKNIMYTGNGCCSCLFSLLWPWQSDRCEKLWVQEDFPWQFTSNNCGAGAQLSCYCIYFDLAASWLCWEPVAAECTSVGAGLAFN